jgi:hypothetical protein
VRRRRAGRRATRRAAPRAEVPTQTPSYSSGPERPGSVGRRRGSSSRATEVVRPKVSARAGRRDSATAGSSALTTTAAPPAASGPGSPRRARPRLAVAVSWSRAGPSAPARGPELAGHREASRDLEQPTSVRGRRVVVEKRRGHAGEQVGAARVGHQAPPRGLTCGQEPHGGRLAVGGEMIPAPCPAGGDSPTASGRILSRTLPGRLVPPPRPSRRESRPAARARVSVGAGIGRIVAGRAGAPTQTLAASSR